MTVAVLNVSAVALLVATVVFGAPSSCANCTIGYVGVYEKSGANIYDVIVPLPITIDPSCTTFDAPTLATIVVFCADVLVDSPQCGVVFIPAHQIDL